MKTWSPINNGSFGTFYIQISQKFEPRWVFEGTRKQLNTSEILLVDKTIRFWLTFSIFGAMHVKQKRETDGTLHRFDVHKTQIRRNSYEYSSQCRPVSHALTFKWYIFRELAFAFEIIIHENYLKVLLYQKV